MMLAEQTPAVADDDQRVGAGAEGVSEVVACLCHPEGGRQGQFVTGAEDPSLGAAQLHPAQQPGGGITAGILGGGQSVGDPQRVRLLGAEYPGHHRDELAQLIDAALVAAVVAPNRDQPRHAKGGGMFVSECFAPDGQHLAGIVDGTEAVPGGPARGRQREQRGQG